MSDAPKPDPQALVDTKQERSWLEQNRDAIASINAFIGRHGLIANRLRFRAQREAAHGGPGAHAAASP